MAISNEALEWLDRAEQAREVAGQLTDPGASRAVLQVADTFDRLARAAVARAAVRKRKPKARTGPMISPVRSSFQHKVPLRIERPLLAIRSASVVFPGNAQMIDVKGGYLMPERMSGLPPARRFR